MVLRVLMCFAAERRNALTDSEREHDSMLLLQHRFPVQCYGDHAARELVSHRCCSNTQLQCRYRL